VRTVSPVDGSIYAERAYADAATTAAALAAARRAQRDWRQVALEQRVGLLRAMVTALLAEGETVREQLCWQLGRPLHHCGGELNGFAERAGYMLDVAGEALQTLRVQAAPGIDNFIQREPLGVVLVLAPWNYPYLTAVNSIVPALAAGNAVLLKHSMQTPLCAEQFSAAGARAGLPAGLLQHLHLDHAGVGRLIADEGIGHVVFTGSVAGGRAVQRAAAGRFIHVGLELGGKDPAYVRRDADLEFAAEHIADGAFFNAGQSCCAVERIYVDRAVHDDFVEALRARLGHYRLGHPLQTDTTLGPVINPAAAQRIRAQLAEAERRGARRLVGPGSAPAQATADNYLPAEVLTGVDHGMQLMREETFGPCVGVMAVADEEEAVTLMNDSRYGLSASVWTGDVEAAQRIGGRVDTGTCFMNRCDYLDPALAWCGVKDTGVGCSLSILGYHGLTRPKSFHLRSVTAA